MLQRLQTTLKKGLLLSFLALGLPQVGKADSLQVKKDVFLIDVSRSMQGHGSVSTPYRADQAAPCGAVITMDRRKKIIITSGDIEAFANASAKKWMEDLIRSRPDWGSLDDARKEADRRIKAIEERKKALETSEAQKRKQAIQDAPKEVVSEKHNNVEPANPVYDSNKVKINNTYLTEARRMIIMSEQQGESGGTSHNVDKKNDRKPSTKKIDLNSTPEEVREYWNNSMRTSQRQMSTVAERVAKNAEAMRMSQEAYKRRLQEERAFVVAGVVGVLLVVGVLVLGAFKREAPVKEEPKKEPKS